MRSRQRGLRASYERIERSPDLLRPIIAAEDVAEIVEVLVSGGDEATGADRAPRCRAPRNCRPTLSFHCCHEAALRFLHLHIPQLRVRLP
jgi:hypothetical protein